MRRIFRLKIAAVTVLLAIFVGFVAQIVTSLPPWVVVYELALIFEKAQAVPTVSEVVVPDDPHPGELDDQPVIPDRYEGEIVQVGHLVYQEGE